MQNRILNIQEFEGMLAVDDKIVVEQCDIQIGETTTASGIIISDIKKRKSKAGLVLDVGPKYNGSAEKGYYVIYNEFTGAPVDFGKKIIIGLEPDQIFGILIPKGDARRETNA